MSSATTAIFFKLIRNRAFIRLLYFSITKCKVSTNLKILLQIMSKLSKFWPDADVCIKFSLFTLLPFNSNLQLLFQRSFCKSLEHFTTYNITRCWYFQMKRWHLRPHQPRLEVPGATPRHRSAETEGHPLKNCPPITWTRRTKTPVMITRTRTCWHLSARNLPSAEEAAVSVSTLTKTRRMKTKRRRKKKMRNTITTTIPMEGPNANHINRNRSKPRRNVTEQCQV